MTRTIARPRTISPNSNTQQGHEHEQKARTKKNIKSKEYITITKDNKEEQ